MQGLLEESEPTPKGQMRQTMKSPNRTLTGSLNASTSNKAKEIGSRTPQKIVARASTAKPPTQPISHPSHPQDIEDEIQMSPHPTPQEMMHDEMKNEIEDIQIPDDRPVIENNPEFEKDENLD